jgi:hypothetical protein
MAEFACMPACKQCRINDICPTQVELDYKKDHRRAPYWPDSLAGTRMLCGCRVDIIPTVLGILHPTHVSCAVHGWQALTKVQAAQETAQETLDLPF